VITAEEWDTHWLRIRDELLAEGIDLDQANAKAERECTGQFGERPQEETKR
jgi:hypothetical protein